VVLGQTTFAGASPNAGGISAATLDSPAGVEIGGTQLVVCDRDNHRVLVWDDLTTVATGAAANTVLGQTDFVSRQPNHDDFATASSLNTPLAAEFVGGLLFVADSLNHRVLAYASSSASGIAASFAVGQISLASSQSSGGSTGLDTPSGLASDGTRFYIADRGNHRVVVHHTVPASNGEPADAVLGQTSFALDLPNRGSSTPTKASLSGPRGLFFDGVTLWIADTSNSRIVRVR
jgi:hypothetical protein